MQKRPIYLLVLILVCALWCPAQEFTIRYHAADPEGPGVIAALPRKFNDRPEAETFINNLPLTLRVQGYVGASVDSVRFDSLSADVFLYAGSQYRWRELRTLPADAALLEAVRWPFFSRLAAIDFDGLEKAQNRILDYLEAQGHPFGQVFLDSITIDNNEAAATLVIDRGPLYTIDSIRVVGNAAIRPYLLERHLGLLRGSLYNSRRLDAIGVKLRELAYVEEERPYTLSLRGTGAVVNLYLKQRRSSQVSALVGLLPNANPAKKFLFTGEANVLLRNSLGAGETIGLNWQQLQPSSPRLNIQYQHPYLLRSPVALSFSFDMLRRDSSWLNVQLQLGATYDLGGNRTAGIFFQRRQTVLGTVDTAAVRRSRKLPLLADVSGNNLGFTYQWQGTDYRFNPRRGSELVLLGAAGAKKVRPNNQVMELKDPGFSYARLYDTVQQQTYQLRLVGQGAHYTPLGKQSVLKQGFHIGLFQSGSYYLNELFQVGGYKLLRGFTEESEFLSHYALGTFEYRYLIGADSYFFGFVDGGWGRNAVVRLNYTYIGSGLGLALETGAGIFNLAWALGKRNDSRLDPRQSKVHIGFVNRF